MFPPVFELANASASVRAVLGTSPLRLWLFGEQPQKGATNYVTPYAVWQTVTAVPENHLADVPNADFMLAQVDVYGETPAQVRAGALALRNLYQQHGYITGMREFPRETDTRLYRYQLDVSFHVER